MSLTSLFLSQKGLKLVAQKFPEGMTTGSIPISCLPSPSGPGGRKQSVPQQTSQPAQKKWQFTSEDLSKIQHYLEEVYIPSEPSSESSNLIKPTNHFHCITNNLLVDGNKMSHSRLSMISWKNINLIGTCLISFFEPHLHTIYVICVLSYAHKGCIYVTVIL